MATNARRASSPSSLSRSTWRPSGREGRAPAQAPSTVCTPRADRYALRSMSAAATMPEGASLAEDQRIILNGMSWKDFEVLLAVRGDDAGVRMYYHGGRVELMSPSEGHEGLKTMLARLLE